MADTFAYVALSSAGERRGMVTAADRADAAAQLARVGLVPLRIAPQRRTLLAGLTRERIKPQQVADTARNLAELLATGGVPLLQAIASLEAEETAPALRRVLAGLREAVEAGKGLADAMAARPDVWPDVVVQIIAASDARGDLDRALAEAARFLERALSTRNKIAGALAYPAFVMLMAIGILGFMSVGVLPKLVTMFASAKIALPLPTRVLMAFGAATAHYWYVAIAILAVAGYAARRLFRRPGVRRRFDYLLWRLPAVSLFARNFAYARWAHTVGLMHGAGVPLLETLRLARGVTGTAVLAEALGPVADRVRNGEPLSAALRATGVFPATILQAVALGEEHGTLGEMLIRLGQRYELGTERLLEKLPQLVEPAMIAVIGVIVGTMLLALYWPLVNVYQIAAKGGL